MGTHMIPRNTKGEGRILYIFSTKALIYTVVGGVVGLPFFWILKLFDFKIINPGVFIMVIFALIGFLIGTIKVPNSEKFRVTRIVGGENLDDIILRYFKFRAKGKRIYIQKTKEEEK